jgi:hypothetical protein
MFKMLTFSLAIQFFAGSAWAADYHFVRIWHPLESDKYHIGSNIAGTGILFMPQANAKEDLSVRVRMYRPVEGDFEVFQEETTNAGIPFPAQPGTYQYAYDLQRKGLLMKPGKYVYRIDCFDVSDDKPKLLASSSVFLTAVDANAKNAAPDGKLQRAGSTCISRASQDRLILRDAAAPSKKSPSGVSRSCLTPKRETTLMCTCAFTAPSTETLK